MLRCNYCDVEGGCGSKLYNSLFQEDMTICEDCLEEYTKMECVVEVEF